jgi:hypothetical protein
LFKNTFKRVLWSTPTALVKRGQTSQTPLVTILSGHDDNPDDVTELLNDMAELNTFGETKLNYNIDVKDWLLTTPVNNQLTLSTTIYQPTGNEPADLTHATHENDGYIVTDAMLLATSDITILKDNPVNNTSTMTEGQTNNSERVQSLGDNLSLLWYGISRHQETVIFLRLDMYFNVYFC